MKPDRELQLAANARWLDWRRRPGWSVICPNVDWVHVFPSGPPKFGKPYVIEAPFGLWLDHPNRRVRGKGLDRTNSRTIYISEPYAERLNRNVLETFLELKDLGWEMDIRSDLSCHYPGRTVAVLFWRANTSIKPPEQMTNIELLDYERRVVDLDWMRNELA